MHYLTLPSYSGPELSLAPADKKDSTLTGSNGIAMTKLISIDKDRRKECILFKYFWSI